jgi:hypothetical protein
MAGNTLTIDFDIESREFNGRWYPDVKAWKIESAEAANNTTPSAQATGYSFPEPPPLPAQEPDDLPF